MASKLLQYLYRAEGDKLHRNSNEKDITTPGGIYKFVHPDAKIFDYYNSLARKLGNSKDSSKWSESDIHAIDSISDSTIVASLVEEFYKEYLAGAKLDLLPDEAQVAMMSMYTNSPKKAWKSVQQSIVDMGKSNVIPSNIANIGAVDGIAGRKTEKALRYILSISVDDTICAYYFEALMLSNMKTLYARLALSNFDKYGRYLKGWFNRMDFLNRL